MPILNLTCEDGQMMRLIPLPGGDVEIWASTRSKILDSVKTPFGGLVNDAFIATISKSKRAEVAQFLVSA